MPARSSYDQRSLDYYRQRQGGSQWQPLLSRLFTELASSAGVESALDFLHFVGQRMAEDMPVPEQDTLEGLEQAINERWRTMDWGWCSLSAEADMISIVHGAWPRVNGVNATLATNAMASVLEGAYQFWLQRQGGADVDVVVLKAEPDEPMEFCYGC